MSDDPYRWLENLDGDAAAEWVRARNAETLTDGERFTRLRDDLLAVLDSEDRIPYPSWHGGHLYNLWKDRAPPRGLWRRTTPGGDPRPGPASDGRTDPDAPAA